MCRGGEECKSNEKTCCAFEMKQIDSYFSFVSYGRQSVLWFNAGEKEHGKHTIYSKTLELAQTLLGHTYRHIEYI